MQYCRSGARIHIENLSEDLRDGTEVRHEGLSAGRAAFGLKPSKGGWFRTQQQLLYIDIDVLVLQTTAPKLMTKCYLNTESCIIISSHRITVHEKKLGVGASLKALFQDSTLSLHMSSLRNDLPLRNITYSECLGPISSTSNASLNSSKNFHPKRRKLV